MDEDSKITALLTSGQILPAGRIDLVRSKTKLFFFLFCSLAIFILGTTFLGLSQQKNKELENNGLLGEEKIALLSGNTLLPISDPAAPEPKIVKSIPVFVTAYSSTPWETWGNPFVTAAGTWVREGIVANNKYSFGTKIRFPEIYGDKVFVVEDRMNSRKGSYHFDIWFPSYSQAKEFGAKRTYIEVLEG